MFRISMIMILSLLSAPLFAAEASELNSGDTAWILASIALVCLMTPGLAFFYGGMVKTKHVVSTMYQTFIAIGVVGVIWCLFGYSLAFSGDIGGLIGNLDFALFRNVTGEVKDGLTIPHVSFAMFQGMFAVICPAIIVGAFAERIAFKAWVLIMAAWTLLVYSPVCHWVWGTNGWIAAHGGLDFAGGLVVHTTAGVAGLVAAVTFGRRTEADHEVHPYDTGLVLLGTGLLWFGWFGFNAGSALAADGLAAHAAATTFFAAASAMMAWTFVDWMKGGKPRALGSAIGAVVGLVAITPAAGFVSVSSALIIGAVTAVACHYIADFLMSRLNLDDTLDVFACHGAGGIIGALLTGVFCETAVNAGGADGVLLGNWSVFNANLIGVIAVATYTAIVTFAILKIVNVITPIRVSFEHETSGLDATQHDELINANVDFFKSSDLSGAENNSQE